MYIFFIYIYPVLYAHWPRRRVLGFILLFFLFGSLFPLVPQGGSLYLCMRWLINKILMICFGYRNLCQPLNYTEHINKDSSYDKSFIIWQCPYVVQALWCNLIKIRVEKHSIWGPQKLVSLPFICLLSWNWLEHWGTISINVT